ncbi:MFS transporter [Pseudoroseicyclus sp. H15]
MTFLESLRLARAPGSALAAIGIFWGGLAGLMPDVKASVGASDGQMGAITLCSAFGSVTSMYLAPRLDKVLGPAALPFLGLGMALAFLLPLLAGGVVAMGALFFVMGAAVAQLDIKANVRIGSLEKAHGGHLQNLCHSMFSFAFAIAAFSTALMRRAEVGQGTITLALTLAAMALVPLLITRRGPDIPQEAPSAEAGSSGPRWGVIGLVSLVLFASFVGENATEAWSAIHIERTLGGAPGNGAFGPTMLGLTMGFGRITGQIWAAKFGEERLVLFSGGLGVIGALIVAAAPAPWVVLLGVAFMGLGLAVLVPTANSMLGKRVEREELTHALSRAWMGGMVGFFVGPALMGGLAELFGLRISFAAVAVMIGLVIPAVMMLRRYPVLPKRLRADAAA